jgi:hypothetical protein
MLKSQRAPKRGPGDLLTCGHCGQAASASGSSACTPGFEDPHAWYARQPIRSIVSVRFTFHRLIFFVPILAAWLTLAG